MLLALFFYVVMAGFDPVTPRDPRIKPGDDGKKGRSG